jgi:hypothetical protein
VPAVTPTRPVDRSIAQIWYVLALAIHGRWPISASDYSVMPGMLGTGDLQFPSTSPTLSSEESDRLGLMDYWKDLIGGGMSFIPRTGRDAMVGCTVILPVQAVAAAHPNVKQKSSTPGARTSISKVRSLIGAGCRMSW